MLKPQLAGEFFYGFKFWPEFHHCSRYAVCDMALWTAIYRFFGNTLYGFMAELLFTPFSRVHCFASLLAIDVILSHRSGWTLAKVMVCCLMTPGRYITRTNLDKSSLGSMRPISLEILKILIHKRNSKTKPLKLPPHLPGAVEQYHRALQRKCSAKSLPGTMFLKFWIWIIKALAMTTQINCIWMAKTQQLVMLYVFRGYRGNTQFKSG